MHRYDTALALALAFVGAAACGGGPGDGDGDAAVGAGPDAGGATLYDELDPELQELFDLINEERAAAGVAELSLRADLICAAQSHSNDVGEPEICSHEGTDGSQPPDRVRDCGGTSVFGETLSCGARTPRAVVDGWLSSSGHRAIMLGESPRHVGIGVQNDYWTAVYDDG